MSIDEAELEALEARVSMIAHEAKRVRSHATVVVQQAARTRDHIRQLRAEEAASAQEQDRVEEVTASH